MQNATGFRPARASCGSTRSIPRERREAGLAESASCVVTNPPFFDAKTVRASPDEGRARAHVLAGAEANATLADWIQASLAILAPGGRFVMIHRPEALSAILAAIGSRLGALALLPVHPAIGASAHRLLVSGVKGSKAPLRLAPGLVLHGPDGRLTAEADAIHRGERLIDWGAVGSTAGLEFYAQRRCAVLRSDSIVSIA